MNKKFIGIETSGSHGSVAVGEQGGAVYQSDLGDGSQHGRLVITKLDALLGKVGWQRQQIDTIAVSIGPGSFSGLRIGVAAAKTLAYTANRPVCVVSSLEIIARNGEAFNGLVCPVVDAYGGLVYTAAWRCADGIMERCLDDTVAKPEELPKSLKKARKMGEKVLVLGSGVLRYEEPFGSAGFEMAPESAPRAQHLLRIAMDRNSSADEKQWAEVTPIYLRDPPVSQPKKRT